MTEKEIFKLAVNDEPSENVASFIFHTPEINHLFHGEAFQIALALTTGDQIPARLSTGN